VIDEGLKPYLADSQDAWELAADGSYARTRAKGRTSPASAQLELLERMADKTAAGF
jgi:polyphosphate kinase